MANIIDEIQINNITYKVTLNSDKISNGLKIDTNGVISVNATTGLTADNGGLHLNDDYVKDLVGINLINSGLTYDNQSKKLSVKLGKGLKFNNNDNSIELDVKIDSNGHLYFDTSSNGEATTESPTSGSQ